MPQRACNHHVNASCISCAQIVTSNLNHLFGFCQAASYSNGGQDWSKLFRHYDRDNDGGLTFDEFRRAVRRDAKITRTMLSDQQLHSVFDYVDEDGGGEIDLDEFTQLMSGKFSTKPSKASKKLKQKPTGVRRRPPPPPPRKEVTHVVPTQVCSP